MPPSAGLTHPASQRAAEGRFRQQGRDDQRRLGERETRRDARRLERNDPPPRQPRAEPIARPGEPAAHRSDRPAQLLRRHLVGQALEVAEDDDCPVFLRQPTDLLMDRPGCIIIEHGVALRAFGRQGRHGRPQSLVPLATHRAGTLGGGDSHRHAVQPGRHRPAPADGMRPDRQDQECGLEGVVNVVGIGQRGAADAQDHGPVSGHEGGEGQLGRLVVDITAGGEPLEQLAVAQSGRRPAPEQGRQVSDRGRWTGDHGWRSPTTAD